MNLKRFDYFYIQNNLNLSELYQNYCFILPGQYFIELSAGIFLNPGQFFLEVSSLRLELRGQKVGVLQLYGVDLFLWAKVSGIPLPSTPVTGRGVCTPTPLSQTVMIGTGTVYPNAKDVATT